MAFSIINRKLLSVTPRILQPIYSSRQIYPSYHYRSYSVKSDNTNNLESSSFFDEPTSNLTLDVAPGLNVLGESSLSSLGLCNYSPSGLIQYLMETMHVNLDMPWWMTICTINELQQKKMDFAKNNGMGLSLMIPLFCHGSIFISIFWAIRGMTNLPVDSLKTGGALSFVDLTLPEPYYMLPLLTAATVFYIFETGAEGIKMDTLSKNIKLFFRGSIIFSFFFMTQFPSALTLYWFTSNLFSLTQAKLFRIKSIREFCNIPDTVEHDPEYIAKLKERQKDRFNFSHMQGLYKKALEQENQKNALELTKKRHLHKSNITTYDESSIKSKPKAESDDSKPESMRHRDKF